jgi:hypothetical protein
MAETAPEWAHLFGLYNSGTYNNQWMFIDYKSISAAAADEHHAQDLLWVLEYVPIEQCVRVRV